MLAISGLIWNKLRMGNVTEVGVFDCRSAATSSGAVTIARTGVQLAGIFP